MPKGEKNKLTLEQRAEILALHGKESSYKVAKRFGVSHTAVFKIWKKQAINLRVYNLAGKLSQLFTTPEVVSSIPQSIRESFFDSLTSEERELIISLKGGNT